MLYGRAPELTRIRELLAAARAGDGGAQLLRGEAGIGKTTLIQTARRDAGGAEAAADRLAVFL